MILTSFEIIFPIPSSYLFNESTHHFNLIIEIQSNIIGNYKKDLKKYFNIFIISPNDKYVKKLIILGCKHISLDTQSNSLNIRYISRFISIFFGLSTSVSNITWPIIL